MTTSGSTDGSSIPDLGPLVDDLLTLAASSLQRTSDQALGVWKEITSGDYEPKFVLRDTAVFWAGVTKDVAKTFVTVRDFLVGVAQDQEPEAR